MTRMHRELQQNPTYSLHTSDGTQVKNIQGLPAFDLSNPKVRQWWLNICLNATKFADGGGCFCDMSADEYTEFTPEPSGPIMKAWGDGMLSLTRDMQEALGGISYSSENN